MNFFGSKIIDWVKNQTNNICSSEFLPLKIKQPDIILQPFFYRLLCSDYVTKEMVAASTGTSNSQKRIAPSSLLKMHVPIPDIDTQKRIVSIAEQADKSEYDECYPITKPKVIC